MRKQSVIARKIIKGFFTCLSPYCENIIMLQVNHSAPLKILCCNLQIKSLTYELRHDIL